MKIIKHLHTWFPAYILGTFQIYLYLAKYFRHGCMDSLSYFQLSILLVLIAGSILLMLLGRFLLFAFFPKVYDNLDKKITG